MPICKFRNISERDMDLLFMEAFATDPCFARLFLEQTSHSGKPFEVVHVEVGELPAVCRAPVAPVQYRVERACDLCGFDLEDDQSNSHLLISLRASQESSGPSRTGPRPHLGAGAVFRTRNARLQRRGLGFRFSRACRVIPCFP